MIWTEVIQENITMRTANKMSPIEREIMKMQAFVDRYEAKCRSIGFY
jgi:hypothetical protein